MLLGDRDVQPYLEQVARRAEDYEAVTAATAIYSRQRADLFPESFRISHHMPVRFHAHDPPFTGLEMMRHILSVGTEKAKRGMLLQIYNFGADYSWEAAHYDNVVDDALRWVEEQTDEWGQKTAN